ncbi:MAG: peptidylprolyl isomerase [Bacilli bacterium]|jgi:peptidyl-prolyl cis-trans isomerase B (cyclophilin B)|nr:peptidylprolyl isomerase [Bacilli bacterium]
MRKKVGIISLVLIILFTSACSKDNTEGKVEEVSYQETTEKTNYIKIEMQSGDLMLLELYPDKAPITVANFQKLVENKFYDNLTFHRIVENFMIQGGDPEGTGRGGSDETIKGEFLNNGVTNTISHERGVISMARNGVDMNSASSQFFICHADIPSLDGDYAAFGKLIAGFNTLDKLAKTAVNGETPINPPKIKSIRFINIEK